MHQVSFQLNCDNVADLSFHPQVMSNVIVNLKVKVILQVVNLKYQKNNVSFSIKAFRRLETFLFVRGFHADIAAIPMQGRAWLSGDQLGDFHAGLVN